MPLRIKHLFFPMRILIADADPHFSNAARIAIRSGALLVEVVAHADAAVERVKVSPYSAVVLDLALPGGGGSAILARLRRDGFTAPVIALTADTNPESRIAALRLGADDCLVKPLLMAELVARVHALLRRAGRRTGDCLEVEDLVLHCAKRHALRGGRALNLTDREFAALDLLVRAHGQPVSTADLLGALWHGESAPQDNFVAVLMMRVRKKVDDGLATKLVHTLRGRGYAVAAAKP